MSSTEQAPEPTMDEILASIRRIIADDEADVGAKEEGSAPAEPGPAAPAEHNLADDIAKALGTGAEAPAEAAPKPKEEDILELTEADVATPPELKLPPEPAEQAPAPATVTAALEAEPAVVDAEMSAEPALGAEAAAVDVAAVDATMLPDAGAEASAPAMDVSAGMADLAVPEAAEPEVLPVIDEPVDLSLPSQPAPEASVPEMEPAAPEAPIAPEAELAAVPDLAAAAAALDGDIGGVQQQAEMPSDAAAAAPGEPSFASDLAGHGLVLDDPVAEAAPASPAPDPGPESMESIAAAEPQIPIPPVPEMPPVGAEPEPVPDAGLTMEFQADNPADAIADPAAALEAALSDPEPVAQDLPVLEPAPVAEGAPAEVTEIEPEVPALEVVGEVVATAMPSAAIAGDAMPMEAPAESASGGKSSLEDTVKELLKPVLREWLDDNMERILEDAVKDELASSDLTKKG